MKKLTQLSTSVLALFFMGQAFAQPVSQLQGGVTFSIQSHQGNSSQNPSYQPKEYVAVDANAPYNIERTLNRIEYANQASLGSLLTKWQTQSSPIVVAHFGDSHVQTGWQIAPIRQALQDQKGDAGRGMIFPYAIAKTYSQEDYTSSFVGKWKSANSIHQPPKIGVGISGFVATTQDAFTEVNFDFSKSKKPLGNIEATLLFRILDGSYQITIDNGYTSQTLLAYTKEHNPTQSLKFSLPFSDKELKIKIEKLDGQASTFEFHGLNLTKPDSQGVLYHNLGVGGAAYNAIIQQKHFSEQFASLGADLVILDWGTNNILYTNQIANDFEYTVRRTIQQVRQVNPQAAILIASVQEARYKGKNVTVSAEFEQLMRRIAQEEGVLYYDWFHISGGHNSVNLWKSLGYASKDAIHLNGKGYRVKAQLFANALINTLEEHK